jgi:predicted ATPase
VARIISFRVDGLAGRDEPYSAELQQDINVFFGVNGSGKTTLLKILHSALSASTGILSGLPFKAAEVKIHLNKYDAVFTRKLEQGQATKRTDRPRLRSLMAGTTASEKPKWISEPPEPDDERLTPYSVGYLPITRLYRAVGPQSLGLSPLTMGSNAMSDEELDSRFAAELQRIWTEYSAGVSNDISKVQERGLANILHFVLSGEEPATEDDAALASHEAYQRVTSFLGRQIGLEGVLETQEDFVSKYKKSGQIKAIVKQIDLVEKSIERITAPRGRLKSLLESMYAGNKRILLSDKEISIELPKTGQIRLPSLSSGEKQLLFISLAALRVGNSSLIIDEPELSMHVDWQKKLITSLRELNPNLQLIVATHSPEIMADVPDDKVFSM